MMTEQPDEIVVPEDEVDDDVSLLDPDNTDDDDVDEDDIHPDNDDEVIADD
jgi:hypothetical protein